MKRHKSLVDVLRAVPPQNGHARPTAAPLPEDQRGDAWEPPEAGPSSYSGAPAAGFGSGSPSYKGGTGTESRKGRADGFPPLIPASQLTRTAEDAQWLWHGYVGRDLITLFSALWKAGKTTLLSHLLRALQTGGKFCGLSVAKAKVLYVTEESQSLWAERRDRLGLEDSVQFLIRPFVGKPDRGKWLALINHLGERLAEWPADLIVFDTLSALWPVRDENDAAQVQEALMPLRQLSEGRSLLLVHHLRKGDGSEGTASRGSGALPSFVDNIVELRRFRADDRDDRRRVLTAYGRYDATPAEVVVELTDGGYVAHGDRGNVQSFDIATTLLRVLPADIPGWTLDDIRDEWPEGSPPHKGKLLAALKEGFENGCWHRAGKGKKGDPWTYWKKGSTGFGSGSGPIGKGTGTESLEA